MIIKLKYPLFFYIFLFGFQVTGVNSLTCSDRLQSVYLKKYYLSLKPTASIKLKRKEKYKKLNLDSDDHSKWAVGKQPLKLLGEGYRAIVVSDKKNKVYKVANSASDAKKIESEYWLNLYLKNNYSTYGIRVDDITDRHPYFLYLQKVFIPKNKIASNIDSKDFTPLQLEMLEKLFLKAQSFARIVGVGLDLKASNLYWSEKQMDWVLFDCGSRTSYLPYGFTLDLNDFDDYLEVWRQEEPDEK